MRLTVRCVDSGESSSTAGTQEQILELGVRLDQISEKMCSASEQPTLS